MDSIWAVRKDIFLYIPKMKRQGNHPLQGRAPTLLSWGEFSKFGSVMGEFLWRSMDLWWVPGQCLDLFPSQSPFPHRDCLWTVLFLS